MEGEVLIKVENVSKKFSKDLKKSLKYGYQDLRTLVFGKGKKRELRESEFWAVKDVSFEVRRGECLGLIGHNGAGKSTLLKVLNGLINPDEGRVEMRGRVGALIELGAGFNAILTGRENIYNSAAVYGFTKEETDAKLDEIIAFSELEEFMDMPVQNYSSGMKVRLGFAVASSMEPDILLVDEVLAVGDVGFRIKCLNRIQELLDKCAVIFVSHSMPQVGKICTDAILMKRGEIISHSNEIGNIIEKYFELFDVEDAAEFGNGSSSLLAFELLDFNQKPIQQILKNQEFIFELKFKVSNQYPKVSCALIIQDIEMKAVAVSEILEHDKIINNNGEIISIKIAGHNILSNGRYTVSFEIYELKEMNNKLLKGETLLSKRNILTMYSKGFNQINYCPVQMPVKWSLI